MKGILKEIVAKAMKDKAAPCKDESEINDLEFAVAEFFNAKSNKEKADAFKAALQLVKEAPQDE